MPGYKKDDLVDNFPFRNLVLASDVSICEIARRTKRDEASIRASIGTRKTKYGRYQKKCGYDTAASICQAVNVDPIDYGL